MNTTNIPLDIIAPSKNESTVFDSDTIQIFNYPKNTIC